MLRKQDSQRPVRFLKAEFRVYRYWLATVLTAAAPMQPLISSFWSKRPRKLCSASNEPKLCGFLSARSTYNSLSIIKIVIPDGLPQHQRVHEAFQIYQVPSRFEVIQPSAKVYILHFTLNYNSVTHEKCVPRLVRAYMYIKDQYTLLGLGLIYFHCVT